MSNLIRLESRLREITSLARALSSRDQLKRIIPADVLFFSSDANKGEALSSGQMFSKLLDPLNILLTSRGFKCADFANPGSKLRGQQTWAGTITINRSFAKALIKDIFSLRREKDYFRRKFFRELLSKTRVRAIFTIGGMSALREAARELGIPCVEVLHGKGYREDPRTWLAPKALPSHAIVFDSTSSTLLKNHYGSQIGILDSQDYWLGRFIRNTNLDDESTSDWNSFFFSSILPNTARPLRVLVSLTYGYAGESPAFAGRFPNGLFPEELLGAIEELGDLGFWYFRFHPVQLESAAKVHRLQRHYMNELAAKRKNIDWSMASKAPLPLLLSRVTHNLTTSSSLCYEAAEFGVPTYTVSENLGEGGRNAQKFEDLVQEGYLTKGSADPQKIARWISQTAMKPARGMTSFGKPIENHLDDLGLGTKRGKARKQADAEDD